MLKTLSIINYALIENLEIDFPSGFSVITGETGAGKSIILGALSLILGRRADPSVIRDSSKKCIIEGVFDNEKLKLTEFFSENDLDIEEQTIIRREILPSGKSRAFINDTPVNLTLLSFLGNKFVNIHSQHQTLQLSDASFQLNVLDDFVNKPIIIDEYKDLYNSFTMLNKRLIKLTELSNKAMHDEDYIRFQLEELEDAELNADTITELETRAKFLENAEEIKMALRNAASILDNDETSVLLNVSNLEQVIRKIQSYLPDSNNLTKRLESVLIELKDIHSDIELLNSKDDFDPAELQLANDKLSVVYSLINKHHVQSVYDLIALKNEYELKLINLNSLDEEISSVKKELSIISNQLTDKANELHELRVKGSNELSKEILKVITKLGMKDAGFFVKIDELKDFSPGGIDKVQFMFNANLGVVPGEISKIASGGELSRLMLAVKSMISQEQMLPTVIFDEIDSGVSGKVAGKVGDILRNMAKKHQLISITHLPQIASKADNHFKVIKFTAGNSTITTIKKLDHHERVEELAGMLSSENVTEKAMDVARELMKD